MWNFSRAVSGTSPRSAVPQSKSGAPAANCARLRDAGVKLIFTGRALPRFAVLDDAIVWYGGLDLLGWPRPEDATLCLQDQAVAQELLDLARME